MKSPLHLIIGVILFVLGASFYWYQWRPSSIRQDCSKSAKQSAIVVFQNRLRFDPSFSDEQKASIDKATYKASDEKEYYENCLNSRGLRD